MNLTEATCIQLAAQFLSIALASMLFGFHGQQGAAITVLIWAGIWFAFRWIGIADEPRK